MSILAGCRCRLVWEPGRGGAATRNGHTVKLSAPPDLGRGPVYAMDYARRIIASVRRTVGDKDEDMTAEERAGAEAIIEAVPSRL